MKFLQEVFKINIAIPIQQIFMNKINIGVFIFAYIHQRVYSENSGAN
jgi:hypothetical protein